jgi:hypothetical protein
MSNTSAGGIPGAGLQASSGRMQRPSTAAARLGATSNSGDGGREEEDVNYGNHHHENCFYSNVNNNNTLSNSEGNLSARLEMQERQQQQEEEEQQLKEEQQQEEDEDALRQSLKNEYEQRLVQQQVQDGDNALGDGREHVSVQLPVTGSEDQNFPVTKTQSRDVQMQEYARRLPSMDGFDGLLAVHDDSLHLSTSIAAGTLAGAEYLGKSTTGSGSNSNAMNDAEVDMLLRQYQLAQQELRDEGEIDENGALTVGLSFQMNQQQQMHASGKSVAFDNASNNNNQQQQQQQTQTPANVARLLRAAAAASASTANQPIFGARKEAQVQSTQTLLANALAMQFRQDCSIRPTDAQLLQEEYEATMSPPKPMNASQVFHLSSNGNDSNNNGNANNGNSTTFGNGGSMRATRGRTNTADGAVLYQSRKLFAVPKGEQQQEQ